MVGVFMFYVKPPSNVEYFCKKATSKILSVDDAEIVNNRHLYYIHHVDGDTVDKMADQELLKHMVDNYRYNIDLSIKKSKKGYVTEDGLMYIRVVRESKKWFKDNCGI